MNQQIPASLPRPPPPVPAPELIIVSYVHFALSVVSNFGHGHGHGFGGRDLIQIEFEETGFHPTIHYHMPPLRIQSNLLR
jgi:hypothetical protein